MSWIVIGIGAYLSYLFGKANPEVAAGIIIVMSIVTIGFFIAPTFAWLLLGLSIGGVAIWLIFAYWYVVASFFLALFFFLGALMTIGSLVS